MRPFTLLFACLVFLQTGCGCLERMAEGTEVRTGARPDPEQAEWHRCLFGTRYIPVLPPPAASNVFEKGPY